MKWESDELASHEYQKSRRLQAPVGEARIPGWRNLGPAISRLVLGRLDHGLAEKRISPRDVDGNPPQGISPRDAVENIQENYKASKTVVSLLDHSPSEDCASMDMVLEPSLADLYCERTGPGPDPVRRSRRKHRRSPSMNTDELVGADLEELVCSGMEELMYSEEEREIQYNDIVPHNHPAWSPFESGVIQV